MNNKSHVFIWQKVRRCASNPNGLYPYKAIKVLRLTIGQKAKRVAYIETMPYANPRSLLRRLQRKLIYDEKPFELGHPPNIQNNRSWSVSYEQSEKYPMDKHPSKLMILAGISYWNRSKLFFYIEESEYVRGIAIRVCVLYITVYWYKLYRTFLQNSVLCLSQKRFLKYV